MKPSQIPEFVANWLSASCGSAIVIQALIQWTGAYREAPVASTTVSLGVVSLAAGVLISGWSHAAQGRSQSRQSRDQHV
jgi:hypothetical protein